MTMTNYTGKDNRLVDVGALFDDAELATPSAALWNVLREGVIDSLAYLRSRLLTRQMDDASNIFQFGQKLPLFSSYNLGGTKWAPIHQGGFPTDVPLGLTQADASSSVCLVLEVASPHAMAVLSTVEVSIEGAGYPGCADHDDVPHTVPSLKVYRVTEGDLGLIDEMSDTSATQPIYDAPHMLAVSGLDDGESPLTLGERWLVVITPEGSTHAAANKLAIWDVTAHFACLDEIP